MARVASADDHSSTTTSDDHDTSFAEDLEPIGGTTTNEQGSSSPAVNEPNASGEANSGEYGLQDKDSQMFPNQFDVVTVHGLHGDRERTWQARDESKRETAKGLADFKDNLNFRLMNYGYNALNVFSKKGIAEEASTLLHELTEARESRDKDFFRAIVFVCHDIGGAIIKQALWQTITDPKYAEIADSTKWIIFLGYPHRWHSVYDMEGKIARLVFSGPKAPQSNALLHVKTLARAVIECNEAFVESKIVMSTEILSVRSGLTDLKESIFNQLETAFRTGFAFGYEFLQPHAFLPCAEAMSDLQAMFTDFKDRLKLSDGVEERAEESAYLNAIVSQASPVRSMPLPRYASHPLTSSHQYISWLQNTRSDVLVVHGQKPMQRVSGFAFEEILRTYSTDDIKTYFSFDRNDDRYNSTRAFLMTTAAQWVTIEQVAEADFGFRHEMSRFHSQRSFTDEDLLVLLFRVRTIYTNGETVFVLNNLDECVDKLASFWRLVAEAFESREKPWKLLIFTKSVDSLDDWLKSWPRIALEDGFSLEDINPCVRDEIDCTLHKFDFDHAVGPTIRNYRDDLIRKCDNDIGLTRLLLHDIQNCQSQETLITTLETLPDISIETIFDRSMDAIPGAKRSLAARAITWILFAFRPLSIGELRSALSIAEHTQVLDGTDIINALDDIPIFDFSNTQEVRFQHVKLRDFVLQAQNVWYDVKATAHEMIVERCLDIIGTPAAYESLSAVCTVQHGLLSTPSVKPRTDLAPYAVCYWVRHYCLAPNKSSLIPQVLKFFKDETASRRWQMAHWFMSDPLSRTDRTYLSKLPLLAATGLQDIYERWIVENGISPVDEQTWLPYAVAEAARNGHRNSTLNLLPSVELNSTTAEYVLEAAGSSGEEDVLTGLISHIRTTLPSYIWPAFLVRRASWIGYARVVHALIEAGADLSGSDGAAFGQCSSHVAARNGQVEVVKLLVKHDERLVHALDEKKRTVLSYATMHGSVQMVKVLLENGAPANESKLIPISNACSHGAHAAVRVLLEHGAQTETTQDEPDWWPPLHEAILEGAYRCVQVLLEFNADPNYEGPDGTALQAAVTHNQIEIVKLLVEHDADVNRRRDEDTKTAVHNAISLKSDMTIARYLVEKGADVNLRTSLSSPLFSACLNNNADMVRLLLEKGANVNDVFDDIWTPLHGAYNSAVVTRLLLEAGALVDRVLEKSGRSPLFLAAEWGQTDVVEVLLEYNADVNLQYLLQEEEDSMSGFTPLVATLSEKHGGAARLLLEAGADTSVKPTNGLLPLTYAKTTELLRMVLEFRPDLTLRDTDGDTVLNAIMHRPTIELADVKLLVHAGIDVNAANKDGRTTLHKAIDWDELDIARFLLRRGADIELSALNAGTPLHLACWSGSLAGVRLLKDAGADINIVNAYFGSPAQAVCGRSSPLVSNFNVVERTMLDMLRCLSESSSSPAAAGGTAMKLDVNAAGGLFGSALGAACYHATVPVIEFLLNIGALTDTCDQAGRRPIHFAAVGQSTANFETLRDANADLYARDKAGRTIVHFAIVSGRLDLLQCVLQSTDGLLDVADDDGWTPLHYAARGTYHRFANLDGIEEQNERKHEFVAFLIDEHDADVWALSSGPDGKQWSPLKLANYHGAKQKTLDLLTPTTKMSADGTAWNEDFHKSKKAFGQDVGCDACCFKVCGVRYKCKDCWNIDLCYKCYARRDVLHPDHEWELIGQEFEDDPIPELKAVDEDSESDDDDTDTDDDDSSSDESSA